MRAYWVFSKTSAYLKLVLSGSELRLARQELTLEVIAWILSSSYFRLCIPIRRLYIFCKAIHRHTVEEVSKIRAQEDTSHTFVFFILHLSHAFQTLLCLPSITTEVDSCEELDLFEALFTFLDDFEIFLDGWDLWSSIGGVGIPDIVWDKIVSTKKWGNDDWGWYYRGVKRNIY